MDAFAFLHLVVPPLHVGATVGNCHSQSEAEVAHSDRGDVGDREFFARNEVVLRQLIVELLMESANAKLATLNQRRDLRDRVNMARQTSVDELGMGVAEDLRVANHAFVVSPTLPGADNNGCTVLSINGTRLNRHVFIEARSGINL